MLIKDKENTKKVLLISYWFPPEGGAGVQRMVKTAKYLKSDGWEVHVATVNKVSEHLLYDESLFEDLKGINIHRYKTFYGTKLYLRSNKKVKRIIKLIRRILLPIDIYSDWYIYIIKKIERIIDIENIENIIITSPPYSVSLLAIALKLRNIKCKIIFDIRDLWTLNSRYRNIPLINLIEKKIENYCYYISDFILVVSKEMKIELITNFGIKESKIYLVHNGYDINDFKYYQYEPKDDEKLHIYYVGGMRGNEEDNIIYEFILRCYQRYGDIFDMTIIGDINKLKNPNKYKNLDKILNISGFIPKKRLFAKVKQADVLLLSVTEKLGGKSMITSKIFEYLYIGLPIIAITEKNSLYNLIKNYNNSFICNPWDVACFCNIVNILHNLKKRKNIHRIKFDNIEYFSRKILTLKIEKLLNE